MTEEKVIKNKIEIYKNIVVSLEVMVYKKKEEIKACELQLNELETFAIGDEFYLFKSDPVVTMKMVGLGSGKVCLIRSDSCQKVGNITKVKASGGITKSEFRQMSGGILHKKILNPKGE